uniref:Secreted protein n=1 Tax=Anguilla anguilla TaxID=7936 RepID=A0A0E9UAW2_ANGAN
MTILRMLFVPILRLNLSELIMICPVPPRSAIRLAKLPQPPCVQLFYSLRDISVTAFIISSYNKKEVTLH